MHARCSGVPVSGRRMRLRLWAAATGSSRSTASRSTCRSAGSASDGRDIELTDQEFRLLHLLATHVGIVFSREALLGKIWRGDTFVTVRSVDTLVKRLRRRIEADPANPRFLLTVWGVGYKFADL